MMGYVLKSKINYRNGPKYFLNFGTNLSVMFTQMVGTMEFVSRLCCHCCGSDLCLWLLLSIFMYILN